MFAQHQYYQPLIWIKPELDHTIKNIRNLLEEYSRDLENTEPLTSIKQELHLLRGSLEILEFFGAGLLVEDMKKAICALIDNKVSNKNDVFESLLQATLSIDAYIDKLHKDQNDIPLALLPIVNDIRASINEPLLSESALFLPNLSIVPKTPENISEDQNEAQLQESAKSLRPYYQAALLTWYKDPSDQLSIQQLKLVARNLESASVTSRNRQIWWILGGIFEALSDKGLKSNVSIRLILGQADRIIKTLTQNSEEVFEKNPPTDLLKNALYYISQAKSHGKRIETLKRVYQLDRVMPSEKDLSVLRATLNAPNSSTLISIAKELKKSLDQSKAVIGNFSRNTPEDTSRLQSVITPLKLIADTLTLLSLSDERYLLNQQIKKLIDIIQTGTPPGKEIMLSIATALLQLDSALQNINKTSRKKQDWQLGKSKANTGDDMNNNTISNLPETEYRLLIIKTATEAKNNIAEVKNNILAYLASEKTNKDVLINIPQLLNEIQGSLTISNNEYAARIVGALNQAIHDKLLNEIEEGNNLDFDMLAEAIVSLEYYLEAIAEERSPIEPILEMTQLSLTKLGYPVTPPKVKFKIIPTLEAVVTHISEAPTRMKVNALSLPKMDSPIQHDAQKAFSFTPDEIDEEVVEIFIEEAFEELTGMAMHLQTLKLNPHDQEALSNIRRAYHTLKGSGKIAGANDISNFSGKIEEYIGRILCGALELNQTGISLLNNSQQFLFELTDCFKKKNPAPEELEILTMAIEQIMQSSIKTDKLETAQEQFGKVELSKKIENIAELQPETQDRTFTIDEVDSILHTAATQLNFIENYIQQYASENKIATSPESLNNAVRELHKCAEKTHISEFIQTTDLLEKYLNNITKKDAPMNLEAIEILKEFTSTTYEVLIDLPTLLKVNAVELKHVVEMPTTNKDEQALPVETVETEATIVEELPTEFLESQNSSAEKFPIETLETQGNTAAKNQTEDELSDDIDLINIFMEEAIELIARGNTIIEEYAVNQDDNLFLSSIQRLLHTMKGSARMAGVTSVGNIAHTMESLIELIITNSIQQPDNLVELVQSTFDAINDIAEDIASDNDIRMHYELLEQIETLLHPQPESLDSDSEIVETQPLIEIPGASNIEETTDTEIDQSEKSVSENITQTVDDIIVTETPEALEPPPESSSSVIVRALSGSHQNNVYAAEIAARELHKETSIETSSADSIPEIMAKESKDKIQKDNLIDAIRVDSHKLDAMINIATEGSATNNRIEDHIENLKSNLLEMDKTISRSLLQMRDLQFESQKIKDTSNSDTRTSGRDENDLNIFSAEEQTIQRLMESIGDIENIHSSLTRAMLETDNLVHQQKKLQTELYEDLLSTRMVSFSIQTQRIQRILRQTSKSLDKKATLSLEGTDGSIDRSLLEKLMGPMEHVIRNAIAHGIELPAQRKEAHKNETGNVTISFSKDQSEHVIEIRDDGAGINIEKVKQKAISQGLLEENEDISDDDIKHLIFEPGFSTSNEISQISGRGVGMDVVLNEVQKLGGTVNINSQSGTGSSFIIRVPFTSSRNHTLFVKVNNNTYALPSSSVVHTFSIGQQALEKMYTNSSPAYEFEDSRFPLWYMDALLNETETYLPEKHRQAYVVLLKHNHKLLALHVDEVNETRDSVLQPSNPQLTGLQGIAGTTVLGDGKVVLILDIPAVMKLADSRSNKPRKIIFSDKNIDNSSIIKALIVDDSVTVRKVTERFLTRYGMQTTSAKDGTEALEKIQIEKPDVILLDIEMPNMDGLELAKKIKSDKLLHNTPIIMITSRTGQQHRQKANDIGVEVFLGKPYQESELLGYIQALTGKRTSKKA